MSEVGEKFCELVLIGESDIISQVDWLATYYVLLTVLSGIVPLLQEMFSVVLSVKLAKWCEFSNLLESAS